jgi:hypothetical protein
MGFCSPAKATCCSILSGFAIVFLGIIGLMLQTNPIYVHGIPDPVGTSNFVHLLTTICTFFGTTVVLLQVESRYPSLQQIPLLTSLPIVVFSWVYFILSPLFCALPMHLVSVFSGK